MSDRHPHTHNTSEHMEQKDETYITNDSVIDKNLSNSMPHRRQACKSALIRRLIPDTTQKVIPLLLPLLIIFFNLPVLDRILPHQTLHCSTTPHLLQRDLMTRIRWTARASWSRDMLESIEASAT